MTLSLRPFAALVAIALASSAYADEITEFRATINAAGAIAPGGATSTETRMTGLGTFKLTVPKTGSPTLAYDIVFEGLDLDGSDGDPTNDATAIHIHDTTGVPHSAGTPHVLNIFGFPSQDDDQAAVDALASHVTGVWDDGDLTDLNLMHANNPTANSDTLTSSLDALLAGELFLMLHTTSPDALPLTPGITIGGRIVPIPEPTALAILASVLTGASFRRRIHPGEGFTAEFAVDAGRKSPANDANQASSRAVEPPCSPCSPW
ncbi:MAG: CHRD domain-containing protein [Planctomycetota bacterium]